ncbi:MAG TPA: pyridoxal-phosphate dependent enzyme, partial [Jatrophihabitans sp.]|nr:pyridoxal-phosphate dependent enzyme [Jatrophihabitans sp.]
GGLIAGSAVAGTSLQPALRVIGVEPTAGDDTRQSLLAGRRVRIDVPRTIADGQAVDLPGELTFAINQRLVEEIVLVSDQEIVEAMRFALDRLKLVIEPSGASPLAALLCGRVPAGRVGVIVSGGNIDHRQLAELLG